MHLHLSKKWLVSGALAVIVLAAPLYANTGKPTPALAADTPVQESTHAITVTGVGDMTIQPDVAYVNLGIQSKGDTASAAQADNAQAFTKLQSVLFDDYKLDQKDVKTTGFNVYPDYSYTDNVQKITGYTTSQTVQVTYRQLDKLGEFLDAASKAGVNLVNGIQFGTEKSDDYQQQVIQKAMANAEQKAKVIAQYAGKDLKGILNVTQNGDATPPVVYSNVQFSAAKADSAASTSISTGTIKISTSVTVQFAF